MYLRICVELKRIERITSADLVWASGSIVTAANQRRLQRDTDCFPSNQPWRRYT